MLEFLEKNIGAVGTFTIIGFTMIFFALFGVKTAHFEFHGILNWWKNRKEQDDYFKFRIKATADYIGFEIPKEFVRIYGKEWGKNNSKEYRLLEERWNHCNVVDITECNPTSTLISILENKSKEFGSIVIYAMHEQVKLLAYLEKVPNVKIEEK